MTVTLVMTHTCPEVEPPERQTPANWTWELSVTEQLVVDQAWSQPVSQHGSQLVIVLTPPSL